MTSAAGSHGRVTTGRPRTGISGWFTFAGIVVLVSGFFNIIDGLVALFNSDYFLVTADQILIFNFAAWGWIWLVLGIVQVATGAGVMAGMTWARVLGIVLAILVALGHLAFLQAFPVWSVIVIALCVLVIYALTVPPQRSAAA
jgi:hypothetical protein